MRMGSEHPKFSIAICYLYRMICMLFLYVTTCHLILEPLCCLPSSEHTSSSCHPYTLFFVGALSHPGQSVPVSSLNLSDLLYPRQGTSTLCLKHFETPLNLSALVLSLIYELWSDRFFPVS